MLLRFPKREAAAVISPDPDGGGPDPEGGGPNTDGVGARSSSGVEEDKTEGSGANDGRRPPPKFRPPKFRPAGPDDTDGGSIHASTSAGSSGNDDNEISAPPAVAAPAAVSVGVGACGSEVDADDGGRRKTARSDFSENCKVDCRRLKLPIAGRAGKASEGVGAATRKMGLDMICLRKKKQKTNDA